MNNFIILRVWFYILYLLFGWFQKRLVPYCLVGSKRKGKRMLSKYILDRYTCCPSPLSLIIMYVIRQSKTDSWLLMLCLRTSEVHHRHFRDSWVDKSFRRKLSWKIAFPYTHYTTNSISSTFLQWKSVLIIMEIKAGLSALVTGGASGIGNTPIIISSSFSLFNFKQIFA